ncbi:unnamed protein product [Echinostoma caproni]|uniref:RING-type domain-containing protein n=1 Tax=Echinostoma caproni TaxID=27848 RepID=A0A183AEI1_9TREM|nr:unnamed protein product [Echinostoma caproni]
MSSQRRRKLWSLAARAAVKCTDETDKTTAPPPTTEITGASPFWSKDSLVKTQDSGVSVDLHSDGLQCGSMSASLTSAQQRVSFEVKNPSHSPGQVKSPRTVPRRLHSAQECLSTESGMRLRPRSGSGLGARDSLAISVPHDVQDPGVWHISRTQQAKKRKASAQHWGSADTSGLGSSLDWASVDVVQQHQHHQQQHQQQPMRQLSACFPQPARLSGNPISMRSLDEPILIGGPTGLYQQTPTACLTPGARPHGADYSLERGVISMHNSPVGPHRHIGSFPPPPHSVPDPLEFDRSSYPHRLYVDPFGHLSSPAVASIPLLVTRSLDQADPIHCPLDSSSPHLARETVQYHSVPGSIGHPGAIGLTHINPRYAHSSMRSNMTEYANPYRSWIPVQEQPPLLPPQQQSILTAPTTIPAVRYAQQTGNLLPSPSNLSPRDIGYLADSGRRRTMEYESPLLGIEPPHRRDRWTARGSVYRRSHTLDETGGSRIPRMDYRRPLIMYSIPPPTDTVTPLVSHGTGPIIPGLARGAPVCDYNPDYGFNRTGWGAPTMGPGLIIPPHRMRYSREETIMEDWDAEEDRRTYINTDRTFRRPEGTIKHPVTWKPYDQSIPSEFIQSR